MEAQRACKGDHLGGDDGVRAGAVSDDDAGVVDHAARTSPVHEPRRLEKEVFGLEARKSGIVLDEQPTRIGQHQSGTLRGDHLTGDRHAVRRCVMLRLSARGELIFAGTLWRAAQSHFSDPTRQRAVGYVKIILLGEQLLDAHHITARTAEGILESGQRLRVARRRGRALAVVRAQDAAYSVTRELEQTADLAQAMTLRLENTHAVADLHEGRARHIA